MIKLFLARLVRRLAWHIGDWANQTVNRKGGDGQTDPDRQDPERARGPIDLEA